MKTSDLIKCLTDDLAKYGNREIEIDLFTDNQINFLRIAGVNSDSKKIAIHCEINDLNEFKKNIKRR